MPERKALPDGAAKRVLVVDDNRDGADTLGLLLRVSGHQVRTAYNADQAIRAAEEFKPEVVLLDLAMPETDGFTVASRLRDLPETKRALLIALTGYGLPGDRERCLASGFDEHLLKPVDSERVLSLLAGKAAATRTG